MHSYLILGFAVLLSCAASGDTPCNLDECVAGCQAGGFADGTCGAAGCECVTAEAGVDADADADVDTGTDVDVRPDTPVEDSYTDDSRVDDGRVDDGRIDEGGGSFPLCNTAGTCTATECSQCCHDNYGLSSGSCAGTRCTCSGSGSDGETSSSESSG